MKLTKHLFCLVWAVCLMTGIAMSADVSPDSDQIRPEDIRDSFVAPDLGVNIGKADMVRGKAVTIHAGTSTPFRIQDDTPLFAGDTIITLKDGKARLLLNDGSILTLASQTKLVLNQSIYDPESKTRSAFMSMTYGKIRFLITKLQEVKDSNFKVKTHTAVVGVRGSDFIVTADLSSTEVVTLEDTHLEIVSLADPKMSQIMLSDYERIVVELNALASAVETLPLEQAKQLTKDLEIVPEKIQPGADKIPKGVEAKEGGPLKMKEEAKPGIAEKVESKQGIATAAGIAAVSGVAGVEKTGEGKVNPVGIMQILSEKGKSESSEKAVIRIEAKTEAVAKSEQGTPVILPIADVMKLQNSEKIEIKAEAAAKSDQIAPMTIIADAAKPQMIEIKSDIQGKAVEIAIPAAVIELPKAAFIEKTEVREVVRTVVADVLRENKDIIQKDVVEIKFQSANDTTFKSNAANPLLPLISGGTANQQPGTVTGQAENPASGTNPTGTTETKTPAGTVTGQAENPASSTNPTGTTDTKTPAGIVISGQTEKPTTGATDTKVQTGTVIGAHIGTSAATTPMSGTTTATTPTTGTTDPKVPQGTFVGIHPGVSTTNTNPSGTKEPQGTVIGGQTGTTIGTPPPTGTTTLLPGTVIGQTTTPLIGTTILSGSDTTLLRTEIIGEDATLSGLRSRKPHTDPPAVPVSDVGIPKRH